MEKTIAVTCPAKSIWHCRIRVGALHSYCYREAEWLSSFGYPDSADCPSELFLDQ